MSADVLAEIQDLVTNEDVDRFYIVGYSQGATIATYAAYELRFAYPSIPVTFINSASLRAGNGKFALSFNAQIPDALRLVNGNDVAPHYPVRSKRTCIRIFWSTICFGQETIDGYTHVGWEVWFP